jgi:hypothetical protein
MADTKKAFNRVFFAAMANSKSANETYDLLIGVNGKRLVQS